MKTKSSCSLLQVLLLNAILLILSAGCATQDRSYNQDYNQDLPTSPKYVVENVDETHFKITVHQGSPAVGAQRAIYLKAAASAIAQTEAQHRGWKNWDVDYIQERDKGWMHIIVAVVTRKNPVELESAPPNS